MIRGFERKTTTEMIVATVPVVCTAVTVIVGTTIYFAGGEVETLTRALLDNGVKNVLYSYFYVLLMRREKFISRIQEEYPDVRFFLDSGAFTYAVQTKNNHSLPPYDVYVRRYFDYVEEYGSKYSRIAEPDLDGIKEMSEITIDMVDNWREEMLTRFPTLNVMPVFHGWRGPEAFWHYCADDRIKTMALGRYSGTEGAMRRMVMAAHKEGKPVHGFAMTKIQTTLKRVPFDSCDSTSWVMGQKYGTLYIFRGNKFIVLTAENNGKDRRKLYKRYYAAIGCDAQKIINDDLYEVRKCNVISWRMMAERLEEVAKRQGHNLMEGFGHNPPPDAHGDPVTIAREGSPRPQGWVAKRFQERTEEAPRPREREYVESEAKEWPGQQVREEAEAGARSGWAKER